MAPGPVVEDMIESFAAVRRPRVAVLGPGAAPAAWIALAEEVGERLARAGAVVLCGGLGGCMAAAARGARRGGGSCLGILPGDAAAAADPAVDLPLPTGLGEARNLVVVAGAEAVIAIGGSPGTLSEIALALKLGRPVVGLRTWRIRSPDGKASGMRTAGDAAAAVRLALRACRQEAEPAEAGRRRPPAGMPRHPPGRSEQRRQGSAIAARRHGPRRGRRTE
jgi:uncharacterized protein (TIGR00725 family)